MIRMVCTLYANLTAKAKVNMLIMTLMYTCTFIELEGSTKLKPMSLKSSEKDEMQEVATKTNISIHLRLSFLSLKLTLDRHSPQHISAPIIDHTKSNL